jgi:hypothetical protein
MKKTRENKNELSSTIQSSKIDVNDVPLSLSIEERVKLRRTATSSSLTMPSTDVSKAVLVKKKSSIRKTHPVNDDLKQIRQSLKSNNSKKETSIMKTKKSFLGSGLDLDNIVLGNRQRRNVQT